MSLRAWIRDHRAQGRIARRVEAVFGEVALPLSPPDDDPRVARIEPARRRSHDGGGGLATRFGLRLDPGRRGALAVGAAALVAVIVAGSWVLANRPHAAALAVSSPTSGPRSSAAVPVSSAAANPSTGGSRASPSSSVATIVVDVVGKVNKPGVYRLPAGSRVDDAVQAAGGALPGIDLSTLNLAQLLADGQQVAVSVVGAPVGVAGVGASAAVTGPVNLNSATAAQLDALPGVGPVLAQHILDWRNAHGRFTSVDQLREVSGIGEAKYQDLRGLVVV